MATTQNSPISTLAAKRKSPVSKSREKKKGPAKAEDKKAEETQAIVLPPFKYVPTPDVLANLILKASEGKI